MYIIQPDLLLIFLQCISSFSVFSCLRQALPISSLPAPSQYQAWFLHSSGNRTQNIHKPRARRLQIDMPAYCDVHFHRMD